MLDNEGNYGTLDLTDWDSQSIKDLRLERKEEFMAKNKQSATINSFSPLHIQIDPTYCPILRRRRWEDFEQILKDLARWLNYPGFGEPKDAPSIRYMQKAIQQMSNLVKGKPDIACKMTLKIFHMLSACINTFQNTEHT
ncbi:hypothetical protein GOP47_0013187 [Adiantum capillus-veneris]|uniref:Uncharacterized protein n=1 Tax=Adiantum capillus-veneris TaxID=13818 RepID=A0A9D4UNR3_ADICA|nr:hypothetical protein GOP47_0013187 [Adiantum capillus-veneris]